MIFVVPLIIHTASSMTISNIFMPLMTRAIGNSGLYPDDIDRQNLVAFYASSTNGLGAMLGGYLTGICRDKIGNKPALLILGIAKIGAVVLVVIFNLRNVWDITGYLMCFVWGT